jgi:small conductance mechanosensitive channel
MPNLLSQPVLNQSLVLDWSGFDGILQIGLETLPKLFWAIVLLLFTRVVADFTQQLSRQVLTKVEPTIQKFSIQMIGILTWTVGGIAALNLVGIQTTTLVAIVGAAGLAIGLALQSSLSHLAAGIMLISFRPFEVGDSIEGGGVSGKVDSIGLFSTAIVTADNTRITVPNNNLVSGTLKNFTVMGTRRLEIKVDIGDRPLRSTVQAFMQIVERHPKVLTTPKPTSQLMSLSQGEKTVVALRPWCQAEDYDGVKSELMVMIKEYLG